MDGACFFLLLVMRANASSSSLSESLFDPDTQISLYLSGLQGKTVFSSWA
jgi:hypothetical protein